MFVSVVDRATQVGYCCTCSNLDMPDNVIRVDTPLPMEQARIWNRRKMAGIADESSYQSPIRVINGKCVPEGVCSRCLHKFWRPFTNFSQITRADIWLSDFPRTDAHLQGTVCSSSIAGGRPVRENQDYQDSGTLRIGTNCRGTSQSCKSMNPTVVDSDDLPPKSGAHERERTPHLDTAAWEKA